MSFREIAIGALIILANRILQQPDPWNTPLWDSATRIEHRFHLPLFTHNRVHEAGGGGIMRILEEHDREMEDRKTLEMFGIA